MVDPGCRSCPGCRRCWPGGAACRPRSACPGRRARSGAGRWPAPRSLSRPTVRNWSSARPSSVSTPSAPYWASTRSQASSMMRRSTTGRCSSASRIRIACTRRRSLAGSSIRSNGCTACRLSQATAGGAVHGSRTLSCSFGTRERSGAVRCAWHILTDGDSGVRARRPRARPDRACARCSKREDDMEVVGEAGTAEQGLAADPRARARRRHPRRAAARRQRHRGLPGDPVGRCPASAA